MEKDNKKQNENQEITPEEEAKETSSDFIDKEILDVVETMPDEDKGKVIGLFKRSLFEASITRHSTPFAEKVTSEHITKLIDNSDSQDKRDRVERKGQRNYNLLILVIILAFVVFLVVYFKDDKEVLIPLVTAILSFVAGTGFGLGLSKKSED